jgi:hypothetical protein
VHAISLENNCTTVTRLLRAFIPRYWEALYVYRRVFLIVSFFFCFVRHGVFECTDNAAQLSSCKRVSWHSGLCACIRIYFHYGRRFSTPFQHYVNLIPSANHPQSICALTKPPSTMSYYLSQFLL